jgi:hypothetical protein
VKSGAGRQLDLSMTIMEILDVRLIAYVEESYQPALGPRGGLWTILLYVTHMEDLCPSSGDISRMMMKLSQLYLIIFVYGESIDESLVD